MSSISCKIIPNAKNGKPSILFKDILAHTKNRDIAKHIWGFTQTGLFQAEFKDVERDENGEPTYAALSEILGLDKILSAEEKDWGKALDMKLVSKNGTPVEYAMTSEAMARAEEYNASAQSKVAIVRNQENGKSTVSIVDSTPLSIAEADQDRKRSELNKSLITVLQSIGFNVEFVKDLTYNGIFNPKLAENNAGVLKTIIQVANNEEGYNALPEEAAHLILAGLKDHALKQRIDAVFTDEVVRKVLGESYYGYYQRYKDSEKMTVGDRLREEAEGKVLAQLFREGAIQPEVKQTRTLFGRLVDWAMSLFKRLKPNDIENIMVNARNVFAPLTDAMSRNDMDTFIDKKLIMRHPEMYELSAKTEKALQLAQDGEAILFRKYHHLEKQRTTQDTKELRKKLMQIQKKISNQQYGVACYKILKTMGTEINELFDRVDKIGFVYNNSTDLSVIAAESELVNRMASAVRAYTPYLQELINLPRLVQREQLEMDIDWATNIAVEAKAYKEMLAVVQQEIKNARFSVLKQLVTLYYGNMGNKPEGFTETDKVKWKSIDMILERAEEDISWWDTNLFSAGDSRNPLLNVIHKIVVSQQAKRNNIINKHAALMQEAEDKLSKSGYENKFVYQFNEDGEPTMFYVAPVDMSRFTKERDAFITALQETELDYYEIQRKINEWDVEHTEDVEVGKPDPITGARRIEQMPKASLYGVSDFQKGWSQEQKDYYNTLIDMKAEMESLLPSSEQQLYKAPQVRKSASQMFDKDGRGPWGTLKAKYAQEFGVNAENQEYVTTMTDFDDETEIKSIPLYYTKLLDNNRDLSTDATHAMLCYVSMAVNYSEMGQLAQSMRLMQDYVSEDYKVVQKRGNKVMIDMFTTLGRTFGREFRKATTPRVSRTINEYIDRQFFNDTKHEMGTFTTPISNKTFSKDKLFNIFMRLTSISRMGINILSGITNATQGETQMVTEALSGRHFNTKDLLWAKKEYARLLPGYMRHFNTKNRHDMMYMLINQFNSSEDYFRDIQDKNFNNSAFKRVLGRGNIYFLNTCGEHYLHTAGMLSILHNIKIKTASGKEMSLIDNIKQAHDNNGWHLELNEDFQFQERKKALLLGFENEKAGKTDRDKLFINLAQYINNVNASLHGGYSEVEKGNINRHALGRLALQFRQWMFGMYNRLYSRSYYDAVTQSQREGAYVTLYKWVVATINDCKNMSLKAAIENNHLTDEERRNVRVAMANSLTTVFLTIIASLTAGWKDDDDRATRLLAYQIRRLELEMGALTVFPMPGKFVDNIFTLVQSPAAGIKTMETISDVFQLAYWGASVKSGRFKGWWKPAKALWTLTPFYNVQRLIDMDDYNYMFNIFK